MRSVVVVLPASTWAMMPILRISERGVVRAISNFHDSFLGYRGRPELAPRRCRAIDRRSRAWGSRLRWLLKGAEFDTATPQCRKKMLDFDLKSRIKALKGRFGHSWDPCNRGGPHLRERR